MEWRYKSIGESTPRAVLPRAKFTAAEQAMKLLTLALASVLPVAAQAADGTQATPVKFNTAFIQGSEQPPELTEFLKANSVLPGTYRVDIYVNRALSGRRDVVFASNPQSGRIEPCLTLEMLVAFGMDPDRLGADKLKQQPAQQCVDLPARVEFARVDYQPGALRLSISVPQAVLQRSARGYVPPDLWDEGEAVGFANYAFNAARRSNRQEHAQQYYLGLRNGINLGLWRLRNESSLVYGDQQNFRFRSNRTYLQRDLSTWRSQLTLGETFTDSQVFDSVRFRGAAVSSDDAMLPDSERTYAPVIRGTAETNATVEVRQNGFLLYNANVSPGPFEINDIYPSGSNGDLQVTIIEADGRRRTFTQAYASLPIMVPKGTFHYSVAAGQLDSSNDDAVTPGFASAALIYGISEHITGFGGAQLAEDYQAGNIGAGLSTGFGALSADLTQAVSERAQRQTGHSVRLRYANTLDVTNTTLAVAGYRYSTEGYRTLNDHVQAANGRARRNLPGRAKDRMELTVTQTLPAQSGSVSLTASEQRYWDVGGRTRQFYLAYNAAWRTLSYSISLENNRELNGTGQSRNDNRLGLSLTLPLGPHSGSSRLSFNGVRDTRGGYNVQAGVNGQMLDQRNAFYSLQAGHDGSSGSFGSGKLNTTQPYGRFEVGYSQGRDYDAFTVGANGSLLAHAGGVNLGQSLGETFALVQVAKVSGARLSNFSNVETGANGYAVLPYAQPYRTNWVTLDTRRLGADVELDNAVSQIVPRRGAMPVVRFKADSGRRVQFELVQADGSKIPLGASVEDDNGRLLAVVDPSGRALVLSEKDQGQLLVRWSGRSCRASYQLPPRDPARAYERIRVSCQ